MENRWNNNYWHRSWTYPVLLDEDGEYQEPGEPTRDEEMEDRDREVNSE